MFSPSVEQYIEKYYREASHAYEVKKLSLMLFDGINENLKKIPAKTRKFLEVAALLHDIGYNIDAKNHNKHSFDIIKKDWTICPVFFVFNLLIDFYVKIN